VDIDYELKDVISQVESLPEPVWRIKPEDLLNTSPPKPTDGAKIPPFSISASVQTVPASAKEHGINGNGRHKIDKRSDVGFLYFCVKVFCVNLVFIF
jgi:hypothetical protein